MRTSSDVSEETFTGWTILPTDRLETATIASEDMLTDGLRVFYVPLPLVITLVTETILSLATFRLAICLLPLLPCAVLEG